jgi:hypothetical protein
MSVDYDKVFCTLGKLRTPIYMAIEPFKACTGVCDIPTASDPGCASWPGDPLQCLQLLDRVKESEILMVSLIVDDLDSLFCEETATLCRHLNELGVLISFNVPLSSSPHVATRLRKEDEIVKKFSDLRIDSVVLYLSNELLGEIGHELGLMCRKLLYSSLGVVQVHTALPLTSEDRKQILRGVKSIRDATKILSLNLYVVNSGAMTPEFASEQIWELAEGDLDRSLNVILKPPIPVCLAQDSRARFIHGVCPARFTAGVHTATGEFAPCLRLRGEALEHKSEPAWGLDLERPLLTRLPACASCKYENVCGGICRTWES